MKYTRLLLSLFSFFIFLSLAYSVQATNYYISPTGNDVNNGTSESTPIRNFTKAWQLLFPGDTLILLDGTYYQTMAPNVRDGASNPNIDTSDYITYPLDHPLRTKNYITIKAKNDGKAIIDGQNQRLTVLLGYYTQNWKGHYFILEGLVAKNSTEDVYFVMSHNVIIRRSSGFNASTDRNTHVFTTWTDGNPSDPSNILLEDNFASGTGRKMFVAYASYVNVVFRRNVGLWRDWRGAIDCQNHWPTGDNIEIYNWDQPDLSNYPKLLGNSIVENNIALGGTPMYGISLSPNPAMTRENNFLGNISIWAGMQLGGTPRTWNCSDIPSSCQPLTCTKFTEWHAQRAGFNFGVYSHPTYINNTFRDLFAWGNGGVGLSAGEPPDSTGWNSSSRNNILEHLTLANNGLGSPPPQEGAGTEITDNPSLRMFQTYGQLSNLYIEGDSRYPNKNAGARLRYRYVNGTLTNQELWPWPMEQRIKDELAREFGIQNFSVTNTIVPLINQHTAVQVPLTPTPTGPTSTPQPTNTTTPTSIPPTNTPSPTPVSVPGDVNGDGSVDLSDLSILLSNYGKSDMQRINGDLNNDTNVNLSDLSQLLANFGKSG